MPAARTCCSIAASAPVPSAIMVSTVATPMVMPIVVSAVCSLLRDSARTAMARLDPVVISLLWGEKRELAHGQALPVVAAIGDDRAVLERDDPRAVLGDLLLVRDQH